VYRSPEFMEAVRSSEMSSYNLMRRWFVSFAPMQELIPTFALADAAKAREYRALPPLRGSGETGQALRGIGRASLIREAFGLRRIPPLLESTVLP
jgi:hypothetical protein